MDERHAVDLNELILEAEAFARERLDVQLQAAPPERREVLVPPASSIRELRCLPEEKLVARCHAEFPQVFASQTVSAMALFIVADYHY